MSGNGKRYAACITDHKHSSLVYFPQWVDYLGLLLGCVSHPIPFPAGFADSSNQDNAVVDSNITRLIALHFFFLWWYLISL
jgi:hypothetical protein